MAYDEINGKLINPKVSDVIKALQDQLDFHGNTPVTFRIDGEEARDEIQFDPYKNVLVLHLEEV
ncbi:hypothetical protein QM004_12165 [Bacillus subtilis]|uniref:hypothetical protein n=1 Tax=Bacillus subtilis TaxID=1423 RepID=UPI0013647344|nr:hypothetical protein [Bacillus subtilis]QHJ97844.1 hypothetical protein C7M17_00925 [Bacillus subtilis]WIY63858.1 hypothetical protein QM004_12165 [Bacillus subtilis]CAF1820534.1 hypothetical protein NRS6085_04046 [Bacillus subtilis]CAI6274545.1 hypothetical protein NRS6085_11395 [Bacillus subtilis]